MNMNMQFGPGMGPDAAGAGARAGPGPRSAAPGPPPDVPHLLATISRFLQALQAPGGMPPMHVTSFAPANAPSAQFNAMLADGIREVLEGQQLAEPLAEQLAAMTADPALARGAAQQEGAAAGTGGAAAAAAASPATAGQEAAGAGAAAGAPATPTSPGRCE
jgi:hypothetical protein